MTAGVHRPKNWDNVRRPRLESGTRRPARLSNTPLGAPTPRTRTTRSFKESLTERSTDSEKICELSVC